MPGKYTISLAVLVSCVTLLTSQDLNAQVEGGLAITQPIASPASYYYVSKPGELTMQVNVWGFVRNPGRYEVSNKTDLVQLISFAGGPMEDAKLDNVKVSRIVRKDGAVSMRQFYLDLNRLDKLQEGDLTLYPGDTIFIDHTSWVTLRDVFSVVTTAAIITTAVAQVLIVTRR